ncbi:MAG: hypothetical protein CTY20_15340 [Hyphomicrobium sp.]|nr:MAG: hypothetical protein CTY20_15340 [Hyphomicrobium sp.]
MTVDEYLVWARGRPGRYELVNGRPVQMSPETTGHISVKVLVVIAFMDAIEDQGLELHALGDGATVRISDRTAFEPDAVVYGGPELGRKEMIVPAPVIVVEVVSPSSGGRDSSVKLAGYFAVPSVTHYLVVDGDEQTVVHHRRTAGKEIATRLLGSSDTLDLAPTGLSVAVRRFFARR